MRKKLIIISRICETYTVYDVFLCSFNSRNSPSDRYANIFCGLCFVSVFRICLLDTFCFCYSAFMEDFKRARGDTRFILECYVVSFEHEKRNFVSPSEHVDFFLRYKILIKHNDISNDFSKISDQFRRFPKILQDLTNVSVHFLKIFEYFQRFLKIT